MSRCVVCGEQIPEGYGMVCYACYNKYGQQEDLSQIENENRRLKMLLEMERQEHKETCMKLVKAEHDRYRYARRIHFLQTLHELIAEEYRALKKERDALQTALAICEKRLNHSEKDDEPEIKQE